MQKAGFHMSKDFITMRRDASLRTRIAMLALLLGGALAGIAHGADDAAQRLSTTDGTTRFGVQDKNAKGLFYANSAGTVQITSNTILSGTTFYQNGNAILGNAATSGQNIAFN